MTDKDCAIAREVHALLTSAFPHAGDINLAKAADLVSLATETKCEGMTMTVRRSAPFLPYRKQ